MFRQVIRSLFISKNLHGLITGTAGVKALVNLTKTKIEKARVLHVNISVNSGRIGMMHVSF